MSKGGAGKLQRLEVGAVDIAKGLDRMPPVFLTPDPPTDKRKQMAVKKKKVDGEFLKISDGYLCPLSNSIW